MQYIWYTVNISKMSQNLPLAETTRKLWGVTSSSSKTQVLSQGICAKSSPTQMLASAKNQSCGSIDLASFRAILLFVCVFPNYFEFLIITKRSQLSWKYAISLVSDTMCSFHIAKSRLTRPALTLRVYVDCQEFAHKYYRLWAITVLSGEPELAVRIMESTSLRQLQGMLLLVQWLICLVKVDGITKIFRLWGVTLGGFTITWRRRQRLLHTNVDPAYWQAWEWIRETCIAKAAEKQTWWHL